MKTRLIVSVRNLSEAKIARQCRIEWIDVKEPRRGALGEVAPRVAKQIRDGVASDCPLSMGLGELRHLDDDVDLSHTEGFRLVKVGLSGMAGTDWQTRMIQLMERLPVGTEAVGVFYADYCHCAAPRFDDVLYFAFMHDLPALLIDTYDKRCGRLVDYCSQQQLAEMLQRAQCAQLKTAVAGSLTAEEIPDILNLVPDFVAVRGAACDHHRNNHLEPTRICELLAHFPPGRRRRSFAAQTSTRLSRGLNAN